MTTETLADVIKQVARTMAADLRNAMTPAEQETGTDMLCAMNELARLVITVDYESAKDIILDQDNPARQQIVDALAARGIFV